MIVGIARSTYVLSVARSFCTTTMSEFARAKISYKGSNRGELSFEEGEIIEVKSKVSLYPIVQVICNLIPLSLLLFFFIEPKWMVARDKQY